MADNQEEKLIQAAWNQETRAQGAEQAPEPTDASTPDEAPSLNEDNVIAHVGASMLDAAAGEGASDTGDSIPAAELSRYDIVSRLGRGGMGEVFKARDRQLGRLVALKRIRPRVSQSPDTLRRFMAEARAVANLSHFNIVQVYDVGRDDDGQFITMELIDGGDVRKEIRRNGPLPAARAVEITRQVCDALAYAHSQGVIHRDIKPGNILIDGSGTAKLADFGLAQMTTDESLALTRPGAVLGTLEYASPEQLEDSRSVDHRTDIYSLGATLYEMLTGISPRRIESDRIPEELRSCILKSLSPNPNDRQQSAEELANDLGQIVLDDVETLVHKATACLHAGDLEGALERYTRVLDIDPDHAKATESAERIRSKIEEVRAARLQAKEAAARSDWEQAATAWQSVLVIAPGDIEAIQQSAKVESRIRDTQLSEAIDAARKYLAAGDPILAESQCQAALRIDAENAIAADILRAAHRQRETQCRHKIRSGAEAFKKKEYENTIALLTEGLRLMPENHAQREKVERSLDLAQASQSIRQADQAIAAGEMLQAARLLDQAKVKAGSVQSVIDRIERRRRELAAREQRVAHRAARRRLMRKAIPVISGMAVVLVGAWLLFSFLVAGDRPLPASGGTEEANEPTLRFVATPPQWTPRDPREVSDIQSRRNQFLTTLPEYGLKELLAELMSPGSHSPRENQAPAEGLPQQFILNGYLAGVRVLGTTTYVRLTTNGPAFPDQVYADGRMSSDVVVEFDTDEVGLLMADYRSGRFTREPHTPPGTTAAEPLGDRVRVVIERTDWKDFPLPEDTSRRAVSATAQLAYSVLPSMRIFDSPFGKRILWCLSGLAIEKTDQPETWIDAERGRIDAMTNRDEVRNAPGMILRNPHACAGMEGYCQLTYSGIDRTGNSPRLSLEFENSVEGKVTVQAIMSPDLGLHDVVHANLGKGDIVRAHLVLDRPLLLRSATNPHESPFPPIMEALAHHAPLPMSPPGEQLSRRAPRPLDPFMQWNALGAVCSEIESQSAKPASAQYVAGDVSPSLAHSEPSKYLGQSVRWEGRLEELVAHGGVTYIALGVSRSAIGVSRINAFTREPGFIDQVWDYISRSCDHRNADRVVIEGTLRDPETPMFRFAPGFPLVELRAVQRTDDAGSRATVDISRPDSSFRDGYQMTSLERLLLKHPAPGSGVTVVGEYSSYSGLNQTVTIVPDRYDRRRTKITFAAAKEDDFVDYREGDVVEVTGTVSSRTTPSEFVVEGDRIQKLGDLNSAVTAQGRPTPAITLPQDKALWDQIEREPEKHVGQALRMVGRVARVQTQSAGHRIVVENLYQGSRHERAVLLATNSTKAESFFRSLQDGDEILAEVQVKSVEDEEPVFQIVSIAHVRDSEAQIRLQ